MLREALTREMLDAMAPDEAAARFITRRAEGLTASEETLLADWLAADQAHAQALDRSDRAWGVFGDAAGDEILAAMQAHALAAGPQRRWADWQRIAAVAAVLLLFVASSILFVPFLSRSIVGPHRGGGGTNAPSTEYASATEVRRIVLPDGSVMTLDAGSRASAAFDGGRRSIMLERGRAFFDVEHDPTRPFAVTAASRRVVVLGTRFEVDLPRGGLSVTLLKGRVALEPLVAGAASFTLSPGHQFVERGDSRNIRTVDLGSADQPGWCKGLIDLDDISLGEAITQANRYSREQIVIRDPSIATMRVSGQFRTGDAARFARTVAEVYPLRVIDRGTAIELARAE